MQPAFLPRPATRRRGCLRPLLWLILLAFLLVNASAWVQARAMTHFVPSGQPLNQFAAAPLTDKMWALITGVKLPRPENHHTPADHYLPFEIHHIPLSKNEQLEGWFVPHPQPHGIVLMFPGYAGVKEALLTPAAQLYQFGYSSLLVDFRGSGGSSGNDMTLGLREADDVAATVAYAQQRWSGLPIILYGISMGGAAILRAVAMDGVHPAAIMVEGVFDRLLTTVQHRFDAVYLPSWPAAQLLVFWGSVQMGYNGFAHNPADYASGETQVLVAGIDGAKQLVEFPGVGHDMPYVYPAPDVWIATVKQFLGQLE